MEGRDYVIPADVQSVFFDVLEHRIMPGFQAKLNNVETRELLGQVLKSVPAPRLI